MSSRHTRKMRLIVVTIVALIATGAAFGEGMASSRVSARMDARQVVPHKPKGTVARAAGTFTGTLAKGGSGWKLSWRLAYTKLDHPSIVLADVHYGKPGRFGPIIVRLCGPCRSGRHGVVKVKGTWIPAIQSGKAFVTLITGKNPNGEIRGQITAH
jgi:CHRD domain